MRHLCEHCGQKYAIPDERVAGRVLKIRCQKCEGVMLVQGHSMLPQPAAAVAQASMTPRPSLPSGQGGGDKAWYVGVAGKPYGPYSRQDVLSLVERGEVRAKTYMWRTGMAAWHRVNEGGVLDWALGAVEFRESHSDAAAFRTPTGLFEIMPPALVSDGRSYFPDPTLHSGWSVLSEDARNYLEAVARREVDHARRDAWKRTALHVAAFVALTVMGAAGAYASTLM